MELNERQLIKEEFRKELTEFVGNLITHVSSDNNQWTIKGFIDMFCNIYTISADTKVVSKILEIHIFPKILKFASEHGYRIILPDHQNYYPDLSFVSMSDESIIFAVDFKTSYRLPDNPEYCSSFTLGSHGEYFIERTSKKNIQFPYSQYLGHFCLGIIYSRTIPMEKEIAETKIYNIEDLHSITSVVNNFLFFVCEKWEIASDSSGSGNTANIGSISNIKDIISCNGIFKNLGEEVFDDYWINYGKITVLTEDGKNKKITKLKDFLEYRGIDSSRINPRTKKTGVTKQGTRRKKLT
jgi:hypothetical protein